MAEQPKLCQRCFHCGDEGPKRKWYCLTCGKPACGDCKPCPEAGMRGAARPVGRGGQDVPGR